MAKFKRRVRRGRRRFRRKGFYKSKVKKGEVMVNRTSAKLHNVVAPHYYTRLQSGLCGQITSGAAAVASQLYAVQGNGLFKPWDISGLGGTNNFVDMGSAAAGNATIVPPTLAITALQPVGFSTLLGPNAPYSNYRVYGSKLQVTVTPSVSADILQLIVYPMTQQAYAANGNSFVTSAEIAMSMPYAKCITCTGNNNIKQNTIQCYMDSPTMLGFTKQQYQDDPNTKASYAGTPAVNGAWFWVILYQLYSNVAVTGTLSFENRITYYAELLQPNQTLSAQ